MQRCCDASQESRGAGKKRGREAELTSKGTACAVRVPGLDVIGREEHGPPTIEENIHHDAVLDFVLGDGARGREREVASLQKDVAGSKGLHLACQFDQVIQRANRREHGPRVFEEKTRFGVVGREDGGEREEVGAEGGDGVGREELCAGCGDHDGVEDDAGGPVLLQCLRHGMDCLGGSQHADFYDIDPNILDDSVDLCGDEVGRDVVDAADAGCVLCGERRGGGHGIAAMRGDDSLVGL